MGTRADFYIGRGPEAEWLGSIAWDGYPEGLPEHLLRVDKQENFREAVEQFLSTRDDGTFPKDGWPWPWDDSGTSDYAYAFDDGRVWHTIADDRWWPSREEEPNDEQDDYEEKIATLDKAEFPNMKDKQRLTLGKRSGLIVFGA